MGGTWGYVWFMAMLLVSVVAAVPLALLAWARRAETRRGGTHG